jgi:hypothetical protein
MASATAQLSSSRDIGTPVDRRTTRLPAANTNPGTWLVSSSAQTTNMRV